MHTLRRAWLGGAAGLLLFACGSDDDKDGSFESGGPPFSADAGGFGFPSGGASDVPGPMAFADASLPAEREIELSFEAPQAGRSSVYVPNPTTHRVAVVNATTFAIETLSAGLTPTYAASVPGQDVAIVVNVGSNDASLLRTTNGKTDVIRLPLGHDPNAIAVAPDGRHAVVYFDARIGNTTARAFQDVSVLSLAPGEEGARGVSVGFRPRGVQFAADGSKAFVITEDGISIIDLSVSDKTPTIARLVPIGDGVGATSSDIQVMRDGSFALARRQGEEQLRLINLTTGAIRTLGFASLQPALGDGGVDGSVPEAGVPDAAVADAGGLDGGMSLPAGRLDISDVDVAPDGTFALAVVRNAGALLRIPLPGGFEDPSTIEVTHIDDVLVGSVVISKQGNVAALYTTAVPVEALVLVDLTKATAPRSVRLRKAVRTVALSPSGSHAFVIHSPSGSGASDEESRIDASEGYSVVSIASGFPKLQLTTAAVRERDLLVTPDERRVFALLRNDAKAVREVHMIDLASFQIQMTPLAKPPTSIGLVPDAARVFIGQQSEGGMITFLDWNSGSVVHAVSGFELSGRVRQ